MRKHKKWVVKVPVTIMVCVEVASPDADAAIIDANETVDGLQPFFIDANGKVDRLQPLFNDQAKVDRPPLVGLVVRGKPSMVWFDTTSFDQCGLFFSDKTQVEPIE